MMPNSQMAPGATMHPQYEYHFQQFPQSPVSAVPIGEYAVHMDGQPPMQGYQAGAGGKHSNKPYVNRRTDDSRPAEEGDLFSENSNQNGADDYNPHFRAAANSRPPEGTLFRNYIIFLSFIVVDSTQFVVFYRK